MFHRLDITLLGPRWMHPGPADLCLHGRVELRLGGLQVPADARQAECTVSATAIFLMRTLDSDHTKDEPVADHLLPCCGHGMYGLDRGKNVAIIGCPSGFNFWVQRQGDGVELKLEGGQREVFPAAEWRRAVLAFADAVARVYGESPPREPSGDDGEGWTAFRREWRERRGAELS